MTVLSSTLSQEFSVYVPKILNTIIMHQGVELHTVNAVAGVSDIHSTHRFGRKFTNDWKSAKRVDTT